MAYKYLSHTNVWSIWLQQAARVQQTFKDIEDALVTKHGADYVRMNLDSSWATWIKNRARQAEHKMLLFMDTWSNALEVWLPDDEAMDVDDDPNSALYTKIRNIQAEVRRLEGLD